MLAFPDLKVCNWFLAQFAVWTSVISSAVVSAVTVDSCCCQSRSQASQSWKGTRYSRNGVTRETHIARDFSDVLNRCTPFADHLGEKDIHFREV